MLEASNNGISKAAIIAIVNYIELDDSFFSYSPYPIITRLTADKQIIQNIISINSIFVFRK